MIVECPACQAYVEATEKGAFEYPWSDDGPRGRFVLLQCRRCFGPLLVIQDQTGNLAEGDTWSAPTCLYPPSELRVNPKAPQPVQVALDEAFRCYRTRAYTAAAIMCRKTLEGVCDSHGVNGRNLAGMLKAMQTSGLIDNRLFEWSDALRVAGNEAAHGVGTTVSQQDARDLLDFTTAIIDYLFSYRDQFEKFRTRRKG